MSDKRETDKKPSHDSPDDLWEELKKTVTPLKEQPLKTAPEKPMTQKVILKRRPVEHQKTAPERPSEATSLLYTSRKRLKKPTLQARLDLHGMTQDQAFLALQKFIHHSHQNGLQNVIIITGKGRLNMEDPSVPVGVLRRQLPGWLHHQTVHPFIEHYKEARPEDGGGGAFYIKLRK